MSDFSADIKLDLESQEKASEVLQAILKEDVSTESILYQFTTEGQYLLVNIKTNSSENLRLAINIIYPIVGQFLN